MHRSGASAFLDCDRASLRRPRVTLAYAQLMDGTIALARTEQLAVSCELSRVETHRWRAAHDGILVGIGTVLADDPQLNVRFAAGPNPRPVILDSSLRLPATARVLRGDAGPIVLCSLDAPHGRAETLRAMGAQLVRVGRAENGLLLLGQVLDSLYGLGIRRLMVEGGQQVITSFLEERLVDDCAITVSPRFAGGLNVTGAKLSQPWPGLDVRSVRLIGHDIFVVGRFEASRSGEQ